ncbi:hypothetical protein SO802_027836 [Lithocarpus litseifolius]|uniref:Uncharacterized protein n=1 Tax=Lithocarpus litseifolius TaxID=425828 RepID=A0AAW2BPB2_9ROSI
MIMKFLKSGTMRSVKQELMISVCCCACIILPCIWFSLFVHLRFLLVYIYDIFFHVHHYISVCIFLQGDSMKFCTLSLFLYCKNNMKFSTELASDEFLLFCYFFFSVLNF